MTRRRWSRCGKSIGTTTNSTCCTPTTFGSALTFYDQGRLVRSYNCADPLTGLGHDLFLPLTSACWHTQWYDDFSLNSERTRLNLSTKRRSFLNGARRPIDLEWQEFYTFDIASGAIVEQRIVGRWRAWAYAIMALLLQLVLTPVALRVLWRRRNASSRRRGFSVDAATLSAP